MNRVAYVMLFALAVRCATAQTQALQFALPGIQQNANALATEPSIRPLYNPASRASLGPAVSIDVRGDGRPDIFVCSTVVPPNPVATVPCRFLRPQADGSVLDITRQLLGNGALPSLVHPREIVKGDFNRDGRPDVFVAGHGYDAPPFHGEKNVLLLSNPDGTYSDKSSTLPAFSDFTHSACTGDVNGDGFLDIYVGNVGGSESPYFLMGGAGGAFTLSRAALPFGIVARGSLACQLVDLDDDGHLDLVLGAFEPVSLQDTTILWNDGTGDFVRIPPQSLPKGPLGAGNTLVMDILAFDIDHDGKRDLLILSTQNSPSYVGMGVQAFINRGSRAFEDQSSQRLPSGMTRTSGDWCSVLQTADFDGDGWEDLYCEGMGIERNLVRIWRGRGAGVFEAVPAGALPASLDDMTFMVAVDFEGDGRTDLARLGLVGPQLPDVAYRSLLNRTPKTRAADYSNMWWAGTLENGWGMSIQQHASGVQFNALYVYDAQGRPIWYVMPGGTWDTTFTTFTGALYQPTGAPLSAYSPQQLVVGAPVGEARIVFDSLASAALHYTIGSQTGTKRIERQKFGRVDYTRASIREHAGVLIADYPRNVSGLWWGGSAENGWGINIAQQYRNLFGVWYTYGGDGRAAWLVMPDGAWIGNLYKGTLYSTTGSAWLGTSYNPNLLRVSTVGEVTLDFNAGNALGQFQYQFSAGPFAGTAQTKPIVRQPF